MAKYYSVSQIADLFDVCTETVRKWINDGKLRASKEDQLNFGKPRYKFYASAKQLDEFIKKNPRYDYVREKLHPEDPQKETRRTEINECFAELKNMKDDINMLVRNMNNLIEHLNTLLRLEKEEESQ